MLIRIANVLDGPGLEAVRSSLEDPALFEDGRRTAGWHAREVKRNLQATSDDLTQGVLRKLEQALLKHEVFVAAARPKHVVRLLISRYEPGMTYGTHVDDALMEGVRTDLSFTLFLSDPAMYDGGARVIEDTYGERPVKLPAGELILYPSTTPASGGSRDFGRPARSAGLGAQLRARSGAPRDPVRLGDGPPPGAC
jgi:PKHD-type hydroxylase